MRPSLMTYSIPLGSDFSPEDGEVELLQHVVTDVRPAMRVWDEVFEHEGSVTGEFFLLRLFLSFSQPTSHVSCSPEYVFALALCCSRVRVDLPLVICFSFFPSPSTSSFDTFATQFLCVFPLHRSFFVTRRGRAILAASSGRPATSPLPLSFLLRIPPVTVSSPMLSTATHRRHLRRLRRRALSDHGVGQC